MTEDGYFDEFVAKTYDEAHGRNDAAAIDQTVECLAQLAGDGPLLEFAIGTGRVAIPLVERGFDVRGIELSKAMVAQLRKKEAGPPMQIAIGDMRYERLDAQFSLVFLVFNTIDNLTTQEAQVECFENAARHLSAGGRFLIETNVPPLQSLAFGERHAVFACEPDYIGVDEIDVATQNYTSRKIWANKKQSKHLAIPFRYVWPSELDLMARLAGLELAFRWADWDRSPFNHMSRRHISVWQKPA